MIFYFNERNELLSKIFVLVVLITFLSGWSFKADNKYRVKNENKLIWILDGNVLAYYNDVELNSNQVIVQDKSDYAVLTNGVVFRDLDVLIFSEYGKIFKNDEKIVFYDGVIQFDSVFLEIKFNILEYKNDQVFIKKARCSNKMNCVNFNDIKLYYKGDYVVIRNGTSNIKHKKNKLIDYFNFNDSKLTKYLLAWKVR